MTDESDDELTPLCAECGHDAHPEYIDGTDECPAYCCPCVTYVPLPIFVGDEPERSS